MCNYVCKYLCNYVARKIKIFHKHRHTSHFCCGIRVAADVQWNPWIAHATYRWPAGDLPLSQEIYRSHAGSPFPIISAACLCRRAAISRPLKGKLRYNRFEIGSLISVHKFSYSEALILRKMTSLWLEFQSCAAYELSF